MMPTLSSLVAPQVVITTTCGAISADKVGIMTTIVFQRMELCRKECGFGVVAYSCHNANFVVTSGTVHCHRDNLWGHQWRRSWHYDNSWYSVIEIVPLVIWSQRCQWYLFISRLPRINVALYTIASPDHHERVAIAGLNKACCLSIMAILKLTPDSMRFKWGQSGFLHLRGPIFMALRT